MLDDFFTRTCVITRLRSGPLGPYLDDFATLLHQPGYQGEHPTLSWGLSTVRSVADAARPDDG